MKERWICINCLVGWTLPDTNQTRHICWSCGNPGMNCLDAQRVAKINDPALLAFEDRD